MARRGSRDLTVGAMFALALIILSLAVMAVGDQSNLFAKKAYYRVVFPTADGLVVGSPVRMSGVQVGTVSTIQLSKDPQTSGIEVRIGVDNAYAERVREDSTASLRILQLLSGEKFVEIAPGSADRPVLEPGSVVRPAQDRELVEQAAMAAENLNQISVSLKNILGSLERGEGLMGQMITDPEFGKEGLDALVGAFENLRELTEDLKRGQGTVGRLLYDREFAARLDDLAEAIGELPRMIASIELEEGALGALLQKGGTGEQAIENLAAASASLKQVAQRLESREGLVGRLLNDTEYSEELAANLKTITGNLSEITTKINRGEGTLGALVNERTLYDGMEEVVAGVNDSKFARWMLRHYQKKGIKLEPPESPGADEAP